MFRCSYDAAVCVCVMCERMYMCVYDICMRSVYVRNVCIYVALSVLYMCDECAIYVCCVSI
jgi:hypothetical protein